MEYTLKDYQENAVKSVLQQLAKAKKRWKEDGDIHAFSLTATTGAGKTVMAAAVFEALFYGNDDYDFEVDRGAVVLWFSDDPSLNEQSRHELERASDKLGGNLVPISTSFDEEKLEAGNVYFLNTQKLSATSTLLQSGTDKRRYSFWDILRHTIEDKDLTTYLLLDEAHRGMKEDKTRPTIVRKLINGNGIVPAIPIVLGISATVERFNKAMEGTEDRTKLPNIIVDTEKVQAAGLLKDTLILDIPNEDEITVDTVLLRRAIDKFNDKTRAWDSYVEGQSDIPSVVPLMILQVPNTPDHNQIGDYLEIIFEKCPDITIDNVANVFGGGSRQQFGRHDVQYISPERVQESDWIRILIAKDAISTGWNCPRAEVMISFRPANDETHIAQLLGRITRTPLGRRISGNDILNTVEGVLPRFNRKVTEAIVKKMLHGEAGPNSNTGQRVLINPVEMLPNPDVPDGLWELFTSLPTYLLPRQQNNPLRRLTSFAHELARDDLLADAGKKARDKIHKALDACFVQFQTEIEEQTKKVNLVNGESLTINMRDGTFDADSYSEEADEVIVNELYKRATRIITKSVADSYAAYLSKKDFGSITEENLLKSRIKIAGLCMVEAATNEVKDKAKKLSDTWFNSHRVNIRGLSDSRQNKYENIERMTNKPVAKLLIKPSSRKEMTTIQNKDGSTQKIDVYENHLLCDDAKHYPTSLLEWENHVVKTELARQNTDFWYRNPRGGGEISLAIPYLIDGIVKPMHPDFIFFGRNAQGEFVAEIVDPHGPHLADSLPKLKGLAKYAEQHLGMFQRIESIAKINDDYKVLDLKRTDIRDAIASAGSAKVLFEREGAHYL